MSIVYFGERKRREKKKEEDEDGEEEPRGLAACRVLGGQTAAREVAV